MPATVSTLAGLTGAAAAAQSAARQLVNSLPHLRKTRQVIVEQVAEPVDQAVATHDGRPTRASAVVQVQALALGTASLRIGQAVRALAEFVVRMHNADARWRDLRRTLGCGKYDLAEDGTVTVRPGARLSHGEPSADDLQRRLRALLDSVDLADEACASALRDIVAARRPRLTADAASPETAVAEARLAYQEARWAVSVNG